MLFELQRSVIVQHLEDPLLPAFQVTSSCLEIHIVLSCASGWPNLYWLQPSTSCSISLPRKPHHPATISNKIAMWFRPKSGKVKMFLINRLKKYRETRSRPHKYQRQKMKCWNSLLFSLSFAARPVLPFTRQQLVATDEKKDCKCRSRSSKTILSPFVRYI
jgi:hypothetical protein